MPKTLIMTLSTSAEVKNLLRTDVLPTLLSDPELRIVCAVPEKKQAFYQKEFGSDRVVFEAVADLEYGMSRSRAFWRSLSYNSVPTRTVWIRSIKVFTEHKSVGQFFALLWKKLTWFLGCIRPWREFVRMVEFTVFKEDVDAWKPLFEKYRPSLAFATNVIHGTNIALMKYARRQGIPLIGMVKTWDNLSSKGLLLVKPDVLIVPNRVVHADALSLGDMPPNQVFDGGCPQYDTYHNSVDELTREETCAALGIDPTKPFLLYCMGGVMNQDDPSEHLLMLDRAIEDGRLPPATIVLRAHPKYDVRVLKLDQFKHVVFQQPGKKVSDLIGEWELDAEDIRLMLNMLRYADVEYNTGSTMTIESAIFNRPVIIIGFDGYTNRPYYQSVLQGLDVTHYRIVQKLGGVWRVNTEQELIDASREYLKNPQKHAEGRKALVDALVGPIGSAGKQIGARVLQWLK